VGSIKVLVKGARLEYSGNRWGERGGCSQKHLSSSKKPFKRPSGSNASIIQNVTGDCRVANMVEHVRGRKRRHRAQYDPKPARSIVSQKGQAKVKSEFACGSKKRVRPLNGGGKKYMAVTQKKLTWPPRRALRPSRVDLRLIPRGGLKKEPSRRRGRTT